MSIWQLIRLFFSLIPKFWDGLIASIYILLFVHRKLCVNKKFLQLTLKSPTKKVRLMTYCFQIVCNYIQIDHKNWHAGHSHQFFMHCVITESSLSFQTFARSFLLPHFISFIICSIVPLFFYTLQKLDFSFWFAVTKNMLYYIFFILIFSV